MASRTNDGPAGDALDDLEHNIKFISGGIDDLEATLRGRDPGKAHEQLRLMRKVLLPLLEKEDALYVQQGLSSLSLWDPCSEALKEHMELRMAIERACRDPDPNDGSSGDSTQNVVSLIRAHLEKENTVLLPLIRGQAKALNSSVSNLISLKLLERAYSMLIPLLHMDIPAVRFGTRMTLAYLGQMISTLDTSSVRQLTEE